MEAYQKDCEDSMIRSETYRKVLKHRQKCPKWTKDFCLECFGGGLMQFTKNLQEELRRESK